MPADYYCEPFPCNRANCDGTMQYQDDEYGSLASGGSYAVFKCDGCERVGYVQLPD